MKTIGMIGGSTWVSTIDYYRYLNQFVNERLGGVHSAKILMYSCNFNYLQKHSKEGNWNAITERIIKESNRLVHSGADCIMLCANTLHFVADAVEKNISVPIIHIADAVGKELKSRNLHKVGLLGTKFTMEEDFYHSKLKNYGVECIVPELVDRNDIHRIIYEELSINQIIDESKNSLLKSIEYLGSKGAEAIILACTELPLIVKKEDTDLALLDTTIIHSKEVVDCIF